MQLQLHRQQTWVKGLAMAVLALTFVALVFSYVGTDSSRIRSSGLIAFNADDPSQPNLLARHVRLAVIPVLATMHALQRR